MHGYGYDFGLGWLMMILMMVLSFAFLVAVILVIVWAVNRARLGPAESPLDILKRRYARGEITKEEYERMKQELA